MPSHQPLSSFPPVLERIAHSADTTTRLTLLRTTYQLHHIVGPLIYREVYLDRKALAGVFLGWDVGKSAIDEDAGIPRRTEAATKESKGVIRKLVTTITGCGSRSKAKKQKPGSKHSEETEKAKGWGKGEGKDNEPNEDYKPTRNFKTALLPLTDGGASALLSLDALRVVPPWHNVLATVKRVCRGHKSCPLMLAIDTKKLVFRNIKCSGFPVDAEDLLSWHPPSLKQVVCFLTSDGPTTSEHSAALLWQVPKMFLNINRVKIVFLDNTETTAGWDVQHYGLPPDGIRMGGIAPLHAEDLVSIIRRAQRHGRILELYGLEELRFEWGYSSRTRSGVIDDEALLKRIRDELERGNVVLKNSEAHLIIGTEDEYWTGHDWKGEVTQQEIATRIRDRRWVREERRRNARWMEAREDLRAQFDAGKLEDELWTPKQRDFEDAEAPYWFYHNDPEGLDQDDEVTF